MDKQLAIALVDDHALIIKGLESFCVERDWEVTLTCSTGKQALAELPAARWDVLVLDHFLPDMEGVEVLHQLRAEYKESRPILVHSTVPEQALADRVYRLKGNGCINKGCDPQELDKAIRTIAAGERYVSPRFATVLLDRINNPGSVQPHELLSDQEYMVMCQLAYGKTIKEIAVRSDLSVTTVSTYRSRILKKMGLTNNIELAKYALEHSLINP